MSISFIPSLLLYDNVDLPDVQFTLSVSFSSRSVVINGEYTDNSPYAVERFHVLVDGTTYTVRGFPLMIDASQFNVGTTYPVVVSAENIIGNVTVANSSFTIRGKREGAGGRGGGRVLIFIL